MANIVLAARDLELDFQGIRALDCVSVGIEPGQLLAVVGPNGSGKTSLLNVLSGIYKPQKGSVVFCGDDITGKKSHKVAERGIARTFQHVELFGDVTVLDDIMLGCHKDMRGGVLACGVFWGPGRQEEAKFRKRAEGIISFLELSKYRTRLAGTLPLGLQKLVGLGRALAMQPKLILLDEPSSGMQRQEKEDLARFLLRIKRELGLPMLWVEHDINLVVDLADRVMVLDFGRKVAEGGPDEVMNDAEVHAAYFGSTSVSARTPA